MEFQRIHFQGSEVNIKLISSSSSGGAASPLQIRVRLAVAGPAALTFNGVALQEGFEMVTMLKHDMLLAKA
jgi:hypothetical protein